MPYEHGHTLEGAIPPETPAVLVYATFPSAFEALKVGRDLVEQRLAGCVNVLPQMSSVYVWKGQTETSEEAVLIAKVPGAQAARAMDAIKAKHPYETPTILAIPVLSANAGYLQWLREGVS